MGLKVLLKKFIVEILRLGQQINPKPVLIIYGFEVKMLKFVVRKYLVKGLRLTIKE